MLNTFVLVGAFVVNKCHSFQISVYLNHFANQSNNQEICCSKTFISRVFKNIYCHGFELSAPNFYCCNFNDRSVPWVSLYEFVSMQIKLESRAQCVTNGAENSTS